MAVGTWSRPLTQDEISIVLNAIDRCNKNNLWEDHERPGCAAGKLSYDNPGSTVWLHPRNKDTQWVDYSFDEINLLNKLLSNIGNKELLEGPPGRSYMHRLLPGEDIEPHIDRHDTTYFPFIKRYQIYVDIPDGVTINAGHDITPNTLLLFRNDLLHSYNNLSNRPLYLVVFDFWYKFC